MFYFVSAGGERTSESDSSGFFIIPAVAPRLYTGTISLQGFTTWRQQHIAFSQGDNRTLANIALQVGGTAQEIQVVAGAEAVAPVETGENTRP